MLAFRSTPGLMPIRAAVSRDAAEALERDFGFTLLFHLEGTPPAEIHRRGCVPIEEVARLADACHRVGFPWPANGE